MSDFNRKLAYTVWASHTVTSGEAVAKTLDFYIHSGGSREDFQFIGQVKRSDEDRYGFDWSYASGTGAMTVANNTDTLATDDVITVVGSFGNMV